MTCEGCSGAVTKVLNKLGGETDSRENACSFAYKQSLDIDNLCAFFFHSQYTGICKSGCVTIKSILTAN